MSKSTYICLIRGINVGGKKIIKMEQLRKEFEALGFEDVRTYVQSGNVIFKAGARAQDDLSIKIEKMILGKFGFPVSGIVKTPEEINQAIKKNPVFPEKGIDVSQLHLTFLDGAPEKAALRALDALIVPPEQVRYSGSE